MPLGASGRPAALGGGADRRRGDAENDASGAAGYREQNGLVEELKPDKTPGRAERAESPLILRRRTLWSRRAGRPEARADYA